MDNDLNLGDKVHGQANVSREFTEVADRLHVDLLFLNLEAGLFLDGGRYILGSNGAVKFARFASFGSKDYGDPIDLLGETLELGILFGATDLRLRTDLFDLLECAWRGKHSQFLWEQEITPVAVGDFLHIACAP